MSQTIGSSQGSLEERFSYLLQPIRDLAKNWDVDIAHFLEEYLEELEKIEITFDDGITTMNFSEAALLIQGSAGVYAKKVEYLHSLVYQVLDLVSQKKKSKGLPGEEGADNEGEHVDSDEQFLPLDDVPESEGTYTKEQDVTSNKNVWPVPEMPTRLIPLEESEKGDNALYNKKGEVMGNHCDFNTDIGYMSVDGSLLMELKDKVYLGKVSTVGQQQTLHILAEENMDFDHVVNGSVLPTAVENINNNNEEEPCQLEDFHDCEVNGVVNNQQDNVASTGLRAQRKVTFSRPQTKLNPTVDPWAILDPHEKSKLTEKPLRKKKPFKIPSELDDSNKKRKKTKVKVELPPIDEIAEKLFSHRDKFPKNPLKVPDFPELEDAFWHEYKHRLEIKKEEIKKLKQEDGEQFVGVEEPEEKDRQDDVEHLSNAGDDCDEDIISPLQLDDQLFHDHVSQRWRASGDTGHNSSMSDDITLTYEELVLKHAEKFLASAAEYAQITELSRRVSEWEEKIRPVLEQQELHAAFDIHKYGTYIIELLVRGERKAFKELVKGKPEFEICRYTLATLQLANVYNVELSILPDISGNIMDCLYVTLLSTKRHFQDLEDYRVPSLKPT